jgi:uncharacterized protein (TIGR02246 family)
MRNFVTAILILAAATFGGTLGRTVAHAAGAAGAEKQIRKIDKQWVAAVSKKDPKAISEFYATDGSILAPGAPIAQGRDAIAKAWKGFVGLKDFSLTFEPTKISVAKAGDMAYELGTYTLSFSTDKGPVRENGKYVVVWKKVGKTWKVAADIFNNNGKAP